MWGLLKQLNPTLDVRQWHFSCNLPQDKSQQENGFDCGVYLYLYARSFLLQSPIVPSSSIPNFRKQMILELHQKKVQNFEDSTITQGSYYAVEYQKSFYFGRALNYEGQSFFKFKFLHSTGARIFDWPFRDDIEFCHKSCVFYRPATIEGIGPFQFPEIAEVEHVYHHLRKSRKRK